MCTRNRITAGFTAATLVFGLAACDEDRSPAGPSGSPSVEEPQLNNHAPQVGQGTAALIAALNNVAVVIGELNALNNITIADVQVVNVEDVLNNTDILRNARFLNNITILQDFLNNSLNNNDVEISIIEDALNNLNIQIGQVVAVDVLSGGDVVVFFQP
jgi:hypothetical protein